MRANNKIFLSFCAFLCIALSDTWGASPLSKYGNIQPVHNYSSNPFWTPDAPYNQRMPTPVYATGTAIGTAECQQVTTNLIAAQCISRNNCISTRLSDIRPALMMQLTNMPGGNYGTACAGYLDAAFADYVKKYAHAGSGVGNAGFPAPTTPNSAITNQMAQPANNAFPTAKPDWATEQDMRKQELQSLKSASDTPTGIDPDAAFPTTYADLSFTERMDNAQKGYAPYSNNSAYKTIKIENVKKSPAQPATPPQEGEGTSTANNNTTPPLKDNETTTVPDEIVFIL